MPNWVTNSLTISGEPERVKAVREQLGKPFSTYHDVRTENNEWEKQEVRYDNPIISFRNIVFVPDDKLDLYYETHGFADGKEKGNTEWNWYNFNNREWGTKWDIAKSEDTYKETYIVEEAEDYVCYYFQTAWSPPTPAIEKLAQQYPELVIKLDYEEEQGWGGIVEYRGNQIQIIDEWDIPNSHEEMTERRDGYCYCQDASSADELPFADCAIVV